MIDALNMQRPIQRNPLMLINNVAALDNLCQLNPIAKKNVKWNYVKQKYKMFHLTYILKGFVSMNIHPMWQIGAHNLHLDCIINPWTYLNDRNISCYIMPTLLSQKIIFNKFSERFQTHFTNFQNFEHQHTLLKLLISTLYLISKWFTLLLWMNAARQLNKSDLFVWLELLIREKKRGCCGKNLSYQ